MFRPSPFFGTTKNSNGLNRLKSIKEKHLSHDRRFQKGNTDSNKNHRNGRTRTFDTLALRSTALPLSYVPRGRQQAFACCLVGFDVSRRPYAFGLIHATIISRKYPFVVTHFFIFLSGRDFAFKIKSSPFCKGSIWQNGEFSY